MRKNGVLRTVLILLIGIVIGGVLVVSNGHASLFDGWVDNGVGQAATTPESTPARTVVIGPTGIADMVDRVSPAVVNIEATVKVSDGSIDPFFNDPFFRDFFGDRFRIIPRSSYEKGIGTGCIISADGYVLTNQHVVENAVKIEVKVRGVSEAIPARIVGQDHQLDLAVLKLESNRKFATLQMGNSDRMRVGDWVIAIGNPYGLDHTVTVGVVSAKGRPMTIGDREYKNLIQTDAAINPGNSGGPLLSITGELIGINTAVNAQAQGIGFAIPINTAKEVLDQLIKEGKVLRPYIGVGLRDVDRQIGSQLGIPVSQGVMVAQVMPNTPAARAGLRVQDIIVKMDGKEIRNYQELKEVLDQKKVGDTLKLEVIRGQQRLTVTLTLDEKP